ncbi:MAG: hypothetical protein H5U19_08170 [Rhodobacteraceae bacterium]|nr:hypothetical protein [Paracoccaceae bacterium]
MEGQELKDGKARVRTILTGPLARGGMVRKRGVSVEDHERFLSRLEARLSYMADDRLSALAEVIERLAGGPMKNIWPAEVSIMNWARDLQEVPASESRLVRSYLQSAAGDAAMSGEWLVELFLHLKRTGTPPNDYAMKCIRDEAMENMRTRLAIEHAREQGRASPRDLAWLDGYMDTRRRCLDIVNAKTARAPA